MKYALNLAEDGRVLSITEEDFGQEGNVIVDSFPNDDTYQYRYVDGEFIYDPIPQSIYYPIATRNLISGEYITVGGVLYKAIDNIPAGEHIITSQNAIKTTYEEQLYELKKGE